MAARALMGKGARVMRCDRKLVARFAVARVCTSAREKRVKRSTAEKCLMISPGPRGMVRVSTWMRSPGKEAA